MTETNVLYNEELQMLYHGTCLSTIKRQNRPYYFDLKYNTPKHILDVYLEGIQEEIGKDVKFEYFDEKTNEKGKCRKNILYIDSTALKIPLHKLFINQLIRYLATEDQLDVVHVYYNLKKNISDLSFWKLFYVANIVSKKHKNYYSYHQPFLGLNYVVVSNINRILYSLDYTFKIINSTSTQVKINEDILENFKESYYSKNFEFIKKNINYLFANENDVYKCIDNKNCIHLTLNKNYDYYYVDDKYIIISNDDFYKKKYNKKRFKKCQKE